MGSLGAVLGRLGAVLGRLGAVLGCLGAVLGRSGGHLKAFLQRLGVVLKVLLRFKGKDIEKKQHEKQKC